MRPDAAAADRRWEVRQAARAWLRAGAIDGPALAAIEAAYPDDRVRLGPAFRALVFLFTLVALNACYLFVMALTGFGRGAGALALVFGAGLCLLAEIQIGPWKRADAGAEAATGLVGLAYLLAGVFWLLEDGIGLRGQASVGAGLAVATLAFGVAAVRWGLRACAALAALWFFGLLAQAPGGRLLWILAALVLAPLLVQAAEAPRLPPALRRSCEAVLVLALLALYLALHIGSWDSGLVESLAAGGRGQGGRGGPLRPLFILATGLLPLGLLVLGLRLRRRLLLNLGLVLGLVSLVTLRFYVHLAPLWVVLSFGGAAAILAGLGLRHWLDSGAGGERGGFTAEALFEDASKQARLEAVVAVAALSPAARPAEAARFEGAGGRSGGGGATGSF